VDRIVLELEQHAIHFVDLVKQPDAKGRVRHGREEFGG